VESQLLVDPVTSHIPQVITFVGEEKLVNDIPGSRLVRRFGITQLTVNVQNGFLFGVTGVFLQGIVDDREILLVLILLVQ